MQVVADRRSKTERLAADSNGSKPEVNTRQIGLDELSRLSLTRIDDGESVSLRDIVAGKYEDNKPENNPKIA